MRQSGHSPNICTVVPGGGWAPAPAPNRLEEEQEDIFTCFLQWRTEEGRDAWYKNLCNNIAVYDASRRVMGKLKMLAEGGIESRTVIWKEILVRLGCEAAAVGGPAQGNMTSRGGGRMILQAQSVDLPI